MEKIEIDIMRKERGNKEIIGEESEVMKVCEKVGYLKSGCKRIEIDKS